MFWRPLSRGTPTLGLFATKGLAIIAKSVVQGVALSQGVPTLPSTAIGELSKQLIDTITAQTNEVERKVDSLLREPLLTGIRLLGEALALEHTHPEGSNKLAGEAHLAFTRAWALLSDSREDSTFVLALDCIALCLTPHYQGLVPRRLGELDSGLAGLDTRLELLREEARQSLSTADTYSRFLGDDYRDKPWGYVEQRRHTARLRREARQLESDREALEERLYILRALAALSRARHNGG